MHFMAWLKLSRMKVGARFGFGYIDVSEVV
jgi:hypothetical protein